MLRPRAGEQQDQDDDVNDDDDDDPQVPECRDYYEDQDLDPRLLARNKVTITNPTPTPSPMFIPAKFCQHHPLLLTHKCPH